MLNSFTPNTRIVSSQINANFTNLANHGLWFAKEWLVPDVLTVQTIKDYISFPDNITITRVDLIVDTVPTGTTIIVDIERSTDGGASWTTIFTGGTNRPLIAISGRTGNTTTIDVPSGTANTHFYRAKIAQIGSIIAGADLTIIMKGQYVLD